MLLGAGEWAWTLFLVFDQKFPPPQYPLFLKLDCSVLCDVLIQFPTFAELGFSRNVEGLVGQAVHQWTLSFPTFV